MTTVLDATWVFGYGSLIYKIDFPYLRREVASIRGWQRRFWQGSHDHRGTPEAPGRVLTLVSAPGQPCKGIAYLVEPAVFPHLDHREKNGYARMNTTIALHRTGEQVNGLVYIGDEHNFAFMGPEPEALTAEVIARSRGPSGSNPEYLFQLSAALAELDEQDAHVSAIERRVRALRTF